MALLDPFKSVWQTLLSSFQYQYYLLVVGALGVAIAALIVYGSSLGVALWHSPWFWLVVAVFLAIGLWAGVHYGVPWLRERNFLRRSASPYIAAGQESPQEFQAKFVKAVNTLQGLPQLKGKDDPRYVLPWYLLIGGERTGKTGAVQGAGLFSPLIAPGNGAGTQNCDWWISNTAVILDTAGRYVTQADKARDRGEWYRLLRLISHYREHEPINGLLIAVPADELALQSEEQLRAAASRLRERMEEIVRELGIDFPVYLLITKCDSLEGFQEFFSQLPPRMLTEAFGFVDDPSLAAQPDPQLLRGESALQRLSDGLQVICSRLHRFRLTLLDSRQSVKLRQATFCFPEEFVALSRSLLTFATPLFNVDARYHTPLFRGIFFTSAQQRGALVSSLRRQLNLSAPPSLKEEGNAHYFLHDLFQSILPRDRGLVATTEREHRRRRLSRGLRLGSRGGAVLLLSFYFVKAFYADQLPASVDSSKCPAATVDTPSRPLFEEVERCRQTVEDLAKYNRQRSRWFTFFGFTSTFQREEELRQLYAQNFKAKILAPLNARLELAINASDNPVPLVLLLAQRIQLTNRCLSAPRCISQASGEAELDYPLMLDPYGSANSSPQATAQLKAMYRAYLLARVYLEQDRNEDRQRLQRFSNKEFTFDRLRDLINKRSPPITQDQYWELPPPLPVLATPHIDYACSKKGWENDLIGPLQPIQDAVPDIHERFGAFQQEHIKACLEQWRRFLTDFPQGAERWRGTEKRQTLALRLLTTQSPYQRVLTDAWENLAPWLDGRDTMMASLWTQQLQAYASSEQRQAYLDLLAQVAARLKNGPFSEAAFKLVRDAFTESEDASTKEPVHPLIRAWMLASRLAQDNSGGASSPPPTNLFQLFLQEPLRYVWRVLLEAASVQLQNDWTLQVTRSVDGLPMIERLITLYGPEGKVENYKNQVLEPFLKGTSPLGEKFIFPAEITKALDAQEQFSPLLKGTVYPLEVRAGRRSTLVGDSVFFEDQTIFSVACAGKVDWITNKPYSENERAATIQWSYRGCTSATINVAFSSAESERRGERERASSERAFVPAPKRLQLIKRYLGAEGFLQFLQDFHSGSHQFQISEFDPTPDAMVMVQSGIEWVTVNCTIQLPPALDKLLAAVQAAPALSEVSPAASAGRTRQ